ncbi:MAG: hypothetical protein LBC75_01085 [Fibromonadaceae bacterium]|jgi:hypothetical protein|nr:hypothetical protein [Fibromonadaceae bacterium]
MKDRTPPMVARDEELIKIMKVNLLLQEALCLSREVAESHFSQNMELLSLAYFTADKIGYTINEMGREIWDGEVYRRFKADVSNKFDGFRKEVE